MFKFKQYQLREQAGEGGEGGGGKSWRDSLPPELRADPSLSTVKDVASLARQFVDAQSYIGGSIKVPGKDAGEEDWGKFYEKVFSKVPTLMRKPDNADEAGIEQIFKGLGAPDTKDGYKLEGVEETDANLALMRELAAEAKMTPKQFEKAFKVYSDKIAAANDAQAQALKQSRDALVSEWGMAFDTKVAQAVDLMKKTGAPAKLIEAAEAGKVDAETMKWVDKIRTAFGSESPNISNDGKAPASTMTPSEARSAIREIQNNKAHPYWNSRDPGHKSAIERMVELNRMAGPNS